MALLVGELKAALGLDTSKYDQGLDRSHARFSKFVKGAAIASAAAAVAAGAGLLGLAKGAAEDEKAQGVLAKTLKNTAKATDAQVASIETYITKTGAATGVTDDEMRPALANLVRATHDVGKAQSLMGIAMDVSTGTGRDLGAVTLALAKAQNGSVGGLAKLGIATKDASGKTMSFDQIQKNLAKTFKGQTAAAAETTAGKFARLKLIVSEAGESIGYKVLPVLLGLGNFLLNTVVPAMVTFGTRIEVKVLPVLRLLGAFFAAQIMPRLREFGGFITGTLLPNLGQFTGFIKNQFVSYVIPAVKNLVAVFKPLVVEVGTALVGAYRKLAPPIISLGTAIATNVGPVLKGFTGFLRENGTIVRAVAVGVGAIVGALLLYKGALGVVSIATKAYAAVQAALNFVMEANPIGIVVLALVGLAAGLVYAYKHSEKFREIVDGAFRAVANVVTTVVGAVVGFFRDNWKRLPLLLLGPIGIVLFIFKGLPGKIVQALGNLGRLLLQAGKDLVAGLKNGITSIARTIGRWTYDHIISPAVAPFMKAGTWLHQAGKNVIAGFLNGLKEIWTKVTDWISGIATWIRDHKGPVSLDGRLLVPAGKAIMSGFLRGLQSGAGPAWDFVSSVGGKTRKALEAVYAFTSGAVPAGRAGNVALGQRMAASLYGWTGAQWDTLYNLWLGESGWNNLADNPTSTAFGIPQFLAGTARQYGVYGVTDPAQQIAAGLRYIADRYGSPIQAFGAWMGRSPHWYAKGTPWVPDDQLAYVHRGEAIIPADVNRARRDAVRAAPSGPLELGERSLQRLARLLAGIAITLDGKRLDAALSSRALQGGY